MKKVKKWLTKITGFLFVTAQVSALIWVTWSYIIATYATVALGQPFPVVELSQEAIHTILGMTALKVVGNVFEHNDGPIWGYRNNEEDTYGPV